MFSKKFLKDAAERMVKTFFQVGIPLVSLSDLSTVRSAALAGVGAALSLVMSLVSTQVGDQESASLVVPSVKSDEG